MFNLRHPIYSKVHIISITALSWSGWESPGQWLTALLYVCETWTIAQREAQRLEVFHMRSFMRLLGVILLDRIPYQDIRSRFNSIPLIADLIAHWRPRWLGHVGRMDHDRLPLQMMFCRMEGCGASGRPPKECNECARQGLQSILLISDWWKKCKDREG